MIKYQKDLNFVQYVETYYNDGKDTFCVLESGKVYSWGRKRKEGGIYMRELKEDEAMEVIEEINSLKPVKIKKINIPHIVKFYEKKKIGKIKKDEKN